MKKENFRRCCLSLFTTAMLTVAAMAQSESKLIPLERQREIELALSAAPEHLRQEAGVYVLQRGGYVKARDSKNGFNCAVLQGGNILGPICYDSEGSQTNMKADFRKRELLEQGKSDKEAAAMMDAEYKAGKLLAPRRSGVAYMLSPEFARIDPKTGKSSKVFPPHMMFYAPYLKNADIGAKPEHFNSHSQLFVLDEGKPGAYLIVVPNGHEARHAAGQTSPEKKR